MRTIKFHANNARYDDVYSINITNHLLLPSLTLILLQTQSLASRLALTPTPVLGRPNSYFIHLQAASIVYVYHWNHPVISIKSTHLTSLTFNSNSIKILYSSLSCYDCVPGYYQPLSNQTECLACLAGSYETEYNSTECALCPPGKFSNASAR